MKLAHVISHIPVGPDRVWSVLTDPARLVRGTLGLISLDGEITANGRIVLRSEIDPKRRFRLRITAFEPERHMAWEGGLPFGLFSGRRTFDLSRTESGTQFQMAEHVFGPLAGPISRQIPDLTPSFETFVHGLATLATQEEAKQWQQ